VSLKTLLVLLDEADDSSARLDVACSLAEAHGAHLTVLAISQQISTYIVVGAAAASTVDFGQVEESRKKAQSIAELAKKHIDKRGLLGDVRWTSHELFGLREAVSLQGRHADLTIAGQPTDGFCRNLREAALEGALFSSGRPILMTPVNWKKPINASHIIVAWDGSKEASRSVCDAAPFLDRAAKATIVIVDPEPEQGGLGQDPGADIATVLARHCSRVELDRIPHAGTTPAQAILTRAKATASDLIVMGGYGHSIMRENLLGGVSREIISTAELPIFLSH
jgi:nucleotide-binding universal stress UspA family protein